MAEHNAFDAHRYLRARALGKRAGKRNWLAAAYPDLAVPPMFRVIPEPEKHSPPVGNTEGE